MGTTGYDALQNSTLVSAAAPHVQMILNKGIRTVPDTFYANYISPTSTATGAIMTDVEGNVLPAVSTELATLGTAGNVLSIAALVGNTLANIP